MLRLSNPDRPQPEYRYDVFPLSEQESAPTWLHSSPSLLVPINPKWCFDNGAIILSLYNKTYVFLWNGCRYFSVNHRSQNELLRKKLIGFSMYSILEERCSACTSNQFRKVFQIFVLWNWNWIDATSPFSRISCSKSESPKTSISLIFGRRFHHHISLARLERFSTEHPWVLGFLEQSEREQ